MKEFHTYRLPNGIRCIHKQIRSEVAYCALIVNAGARDERADVVLPQRGEKRGEVVIIQRAGVAAARVAREEREGVRADGKRRLRYFALRARAPLRQKPIASKAFSSRRTRILR